MNFQGGAILGDRFGTLVLIGKRKGQFVVGVDVGRIQAQGRFIFGLGRVKFLLHGQGAAQGTVQGRSIRFVFERLAVFNRGLVIQILRRVDVAETGARRKQFGIRQCDGVAESGEAQGRFKFGPGFAILFLHDQGSAEGKMKFGIIGRIFQRFSVFCCRLPT